MYIGFITTQFYLFSTHSYSLIVHASVQHFNFRLRYHFGLITDKRNWVFFKCHTYLLYRSRIRFWVEIYRKFCPLSMNLDLKNTKKCQFFQFMDNYSRQRRIYIFFILMYKSGALCLVLIALLFVDINVYQCLIKT